MIRILATSAAISLIIGDSPHHLSLARRLAHDLYLYHRLDSEIIMGRDALERLMKGELGEGNLVIFGRPDENMFAKHLIDAETIPRKYSHISIESSI
jgi:hypothetical protein